MMTYTLKITGETASGKSFMVTHEGSKPFALQKKLAIFLRPPKVGLILQVKVPDYLALRHRELCGTEKFLANKMRLKERRRLKREGNDGWKRLDRHFRESKGKLGLMDQINEVWEPQVSEETVEAFEEASAELGQRLSGYLGGALRDSVGRVVREAA